MCGISGIAGYRGSAEQLTELLRRMNHTQTHRGPDAEGVWSDPVEGVGVAVRRLSVIDLLGGSQPLISEDGNVVVVCNGEIYNHVALRAELAGRGHTFRGGSDCEVIVHLYEELGLEALERLDGMFGLAIVDRARRRVVVARDRMGMKPLYYAETPEGLLFASEARAVLAAGMVEPRPDRQALAAIFTCGYIPAPRTAFKNICRLPAGSCLVLEAGRLHRETYWQPRFQPPSVPDQKVCQQLGSEIDQNSGRAADKEGPLVEELESCLTGAVRSHLAADVPVGVLLSGGLDSSLIAVMAARMSDRPLKTFSLVFPEQSYLDERYYSRQVARQIGSDHREVEVRLSSLPTLLPKVAAAMEEPVSCVPSAMIYLLMQAVSRDVKVALGGEGADELFAGYPWLSDDRPYRLRRVVPRWLAGQLGNHIQNPSWAQALAVMSAADAQAAHRAWQSAGSEHWLRRMLRPGTLNHAPLAELQTPAATWDSSGDLLAERLGVELTGRLAEGILLVHDKLSMAHSMELRMPLLDNRVVQFALRLGSHFKQRGDKEKYLLSRLGGMLPPEVGSRRKQGLVTPLHAMVKGPLRQYIRQCLLESSTGQELFQQKPLERWLNRTMAARRPQSALIWRLLMLRLWWDNVLVPAQQTFQSHSVTLPKHAALVRAA